MDNLFYGIYSYGSLMTGMQFEENIISNSIEYGIWKDNDMGAFFIDNEVCGSGIGDIYDWMCSAYYSTTPGNTCDTNPGCSPVSCTIACT